MKWVLLILITGLFHLVLPFVCLGWLAFNRGKNKLYKLAVALFATSFVFLMKLGGAGWHWLGVWWPILFVILFVPSLVFSIKNSRGLPWFPKKSFFSWLNISILLIFTSVFIIAITQFIALHKYEGKSVELSFPLRNGTYYIVHGGNSTAGNHHYPLLAQRYALDIVKLNHWGLRAKGLMPFNLNAYKIFEDKLFAPCSGEVLSTEDQFSDNIPFQMDSKNPIGNHIIIYCKGFSVLLAHLKKDSVSVSKGDYVKEGQFVGKVGNTGNTSEPHLHIHAVEGKVTSERIAVKAVGVPMIFNDRFLVRGDRFKKIIRKQLYTE